MSLSKGLPPKASNPSDSLFGRRGVGDHNHNHAAANGTTPSSSRNKAGGGSELAFLDYLACSICCHPFRSKNPQRSFSMTECGHILCDDPAHKNQEGRCSKCGRDDISVYPIEAGLSKDLQKWFCAPTVSLRSVRTRLEDLVHEMSANELGVLKFQNGQLMHQVLFLRGELERSQRKIDKAKEQISRTVDLQERLDKLEKETEGLRRENDELRRGRDRADRSSFHAAGSGSRMGNGFASGSALEILPEDEEAEFGDFGAARQNGGAEVDDVLASLQRKRRRTEVPRPFVPPTQRFATPSRAFTPQAPIIPHTSSRLTMRSTLGNQNHFEPEVQEHATRPLSAMPFGSQGVSSANPRRTNLERFRYRGDAMPQTPRQSHPHVTGGHSLFHRPGTAMPLGQANGGVSQPSFLQHLTGSDGGARSFQRPADLPFMTTNGAPSPYHPQQHQAQNHLQQHQAQTYNTAAPYIHNQGPAQAPPQTDDDEYGEFPPLPADMDFEGMY
ncbi:hypothetical protein JCM24511_07217 [Saitozyma sp. JCM 24511]|nr:hypothetical protein JCM24511_07217 [Saitozyma sp. JCM 24511]